MRTSGAAESRRRALFWGGLLCIVALAAVGAGRRPARPAAAGFFCDEAGNGYNAYLLLTTGRDENDERLPLYVWSFGVSYKNPVFIYAGDAADRALRAERVQRPPDRGAVRHRRRARHRPARAARRSAPPAA